MDKPVMSTEELMNMSKQVSNLEDRTGNFMIEGLKKITDNDQLQVILMYSISRQIVKRVKTIIDKCGFNSKELDRVIDDENVIIGSEFIELSKRE